MVSPPYSMTLFIIMEVKFLVSLDSMVPLQRGRNKADELKIGQLKI